MKNKRLPFIILALAAIATIIFFAVSCSKEKSIVDLVNDIEPVHRLDNRYTSVLDTLSTMTDKGKLEYINKQWPTLGNDVVYWVRNYSDDMPAYSRISKTARIDSVVLLFGSGKDAQGNDANGNMHDGGIFDNDLIARIKYGSEFTIGEGEGFCHYISFDVGIDLGRECGIKFYEGRIQTPEHEISYERAWELRDQTDDIQVTAGLKKGDYFNLTTRKCKLVPR